MFKVSCDWQVDRADRDLMLALMHKCQVVPVATGPRLIVEYNRSGLVTGKDIFWCDFYDSWHQEITYNSKLENSALAKAVALPKHQLILDATAGFGRDAFVLSTFGAKVYAVEQHPLIALMLMWSARQITKLEVIPADHRDIIPLKAWDVIYFDFMFDKANRHAKAKQGIELIASLVVDAGLTNATFDMALINCKRLVIKRPKTSKAFAKPNHTLNNKTTCFDIYLGGSK